MKRFGFDDPNVASFISELKQVNLVGSIFMVLLTGPYRKGKKKFILDLAKKIDEEIIHVDLIDIITMNEKETEKNIDAFLNDLSEDEKILFLSNGDRLCGEYAGYTFSKTRYATPQGRYLLRKIRNIEKIIFIDVADEDNVDKTLERHSHAMIRFPRPGSLLKRLTWQLGNLDFHGYNIRSKRPA